MPVEAHKFSVAEYHASVDHGHSDIETRGACKESIHERHIRVKIRFAYYRCAGFRYGVDVTIRDPYAVRDRGAGSHDAQTLQMRKHAVGVERGRSRGLGRRLERMKMQPEAAPVRISCKLRPKRIGYPLRPSRAVAEAYSRMSRVVGQQPLHDSDSGFGGFRVK